MKLGQIILFLTNFVKEVYKQDVMAISK